MHDDPNFPTGLSIGPSQRAVLGGLHLDEGGDGDDDGSFIFFFSSLLDEGRERGGTDARANT